MILKISWSRRNKIIARAARTVVWHDGNLIIRVFVLTKHATILPQAPVVMGVRLRLRDTKDLAERRVPGAYLWTYNQAAQTWTYPTLTSGNSAPHCHTQYVIRRYDLCRVSWASLLICSILILAGIATIIQYS